jgi:hypothetical protein
MNNLKYLFLSMFIMGTITIDAAQEIKKPTLQEIRINNKCRRKIKYLKRASQCGAKNKSCQKNLDAEFNKCKREEMAKLKQK